MQEFLNQLSPNLRLIKVRDCEDKLQVFCEFNSIFERKVHSRYIRIIKDLPYGNKKIELHLLLKKYFNNDASIDKLTIAEKIDFINTTGKRTKRLDEELLKLSKEMSAIGCERHIRDSYADVSDSSILRLLKKNNKKQ